MEAFALDGYVVEELIGFGGTGEVWRAREAATGETVALKRLRASGAAAAERLRREAGLLQTLAGPHVVGLRRMLIDDAAAVLVMDYAAGGSLATVLAARGRLPAPEVVTIVAPVATALAAAHSRDLVHGDLTPANILFTADGRPLLADFGVARAVGKAQGTAPGQVAGTAEFLDPAVAGGAVPSAASDVFALGAVAFAALTGHSPWGSGTPEELTARAATGRRPPVREVAPDAPEPLVEAVEWMLNADPGERPDARTAGHAVLRSGPAAPVGLATGPSPEPPPVTSIVRPAPAPHAGPPRTGPPRTGDRDDRDADWDGWDDDDQGGWTPWRRRVVVATAAGFALIGAAGVGVSLAKGGHGPPGLAAEPVRPVTTATTTTAPATTATTTAPPTTPTGRTAPPTTALGGHDQPAAPGWTAIVAGLDSRRAAAFAQGDPAALAAVYVPGAAAYSTDLATIRGLASRGLRAQGFTATVVRVSVESASAERARLRVVDRLSGYDLMDATGDVLRTAAARPPTAFTMRLTNVDGRWRVAAISPRD